MPKVRAVSVMSTGESKAAIAPPLHLLYRLLGAGGGVGGGDDGLYPLTGPHQGGWGGQIAGNGLCASLNKRLG